MSKIVESLSEEAEESTSVQVSDAYLGLTKGGLGMVELSPKFSKKSLKNN